MDIRMTLVECSVQLCCKKEIALVILRLLFNLVEKHVTSETQVW